MLITKVEWHPAGWPVCLRLLIFPFTKKSRSSLLTPAHPGGPGKRAVKGLWWCGITKVVFWQVLVIACTLWRTVQLLLKIFSRRLKPTYLAFVWRVMLVRSCLLSCQRNSLRISRSYSLIWNLIKPRSVLTVLERQLLHLKRFSWSKCLNCDVRK